AGQCGLRLLGDRAERGGIVHREIREDLAVELDAGLAAAVDELVVRQPMLARARVDARDPELTEGPLAHLPVAIGVDERPLDLLLRVPVMARLPAPVAVRLLEHLAALLLRVDRSLDSRHYLTPSIFFSADRSLRASCTPFRPRFRFPGLLFTRCPGGVVRCRRERRIFPLPVTENRFFAALRVFCFGISS